MGFVLGFAVAGGFFFLPKYLEKRNSVSLPKVLQEGKTNPSPKEQSLTLTVPEDNQVVSTKDIAVRGKTKPGTLVLVSSPVNDYTVTADPTGSFEMSVELAAGLNPISITAYVADSDVETTLRTVAFVL